MEYILGSLLTLATIFFVNRALRPERLPKEKSIRYRQTHIFEIIKTYADLGIAPYVEPVSQSFNHQNKSNLKVLFLDDRAYWIQDSALFVADLVNGMVDEQSKKVVDTMALSKVELDQVIFIVEKLTEGTNNDGRYPGKS
jgi:hypothetical protein